MGSQWQFVTEMTQQECSVAVLPVPVSCESHNLKVHVHPSQRNPALVVDPSFPLSKLGDAELKVRTLRLCWHVVRRLERIFTGLFRTPHLLNERVTVSRQLFVAEANDKHDDDVLHDEVIDLAWILFAALVGIDSTPTKGDVCSGASGYSKALGYDVPVGAPNKGWILARASVLNTLSTSHNLQPENCSLDEVGHRELGQGT